MLLELAMIQVNFCKVGILAGGQTIDIPERVGDMNE